MGKVIDQNLAELKKKALTELYQMAIDGMPVAIAHFSHQTLSERELREIETEIDDCWKTLYEFTKGAIGATFGEQLATLPLSFVKALSTSAKIIKILAALDKISTVINIGQLGVSSGPSRTLRGLGGMGEDTFSHSLLALLGGIP